ncbi:MAG: DMT family transporter [bacterium]|nr:DMT family transporter [bacterium]
MSWLFFALLAAFSFGVGQVFIKKGYENFSPLWNAIIDAGFSLILYIPLALLLGVNLQVTPLHILMITLISALYIFFYYAIEHGNLSLSGTIFATYPLFTILLSMMVLGEKVTLLQATLITLIISGVLLLSYNPGTIQKIRNVSKKKWLAWALFGAFTTGFGDFLSKVTLNTVPINSYLVLFALAFPVTCVFFWFFDKKGRAFPRNISVQKAKWTLLGTAMLSIGVLAISFAFSLGQASLVAPISSSYIGITVLLSYFFLKESLSKKQVFAICMIAIGVAFINT